MKKLFTVLALLIANVSWAVFPPCTTIGQIHTEGNKSYICSVSGAWKEIDSTNYENVMHYGAICDGTSDNTTAIQAAITAAVTTKKIVYIPPCDSFYRFDSQITNDTGVPIQSEATLTFYGSGEDAITFGTAGTTVDYTDTWKGARIKLKVDKAFIDWTDTFSGIVFNNVSRMNAEISVKNFYTGVGFIGTNAGITHNNVEFGKIQNNKRGVVFQAIGVGWVNQNIFYNGDFVVTASLGGASDTICGILFDNDSSNTLNGNVFYNPSYQISANTGAGASGIAICNDTVTDNLDTHSNTWFGLRSESNTNCLLGGDNEFQDNTFYFGTGIGWNGELFTDASPFCGNDSEANNNLANNNFYPNGEAAYDNKWLEVAKVGREDLVESASGIWASTDSVWISHPAGTTSAVFSNINVYLQNEYLYHDVEQDLLAVKLDLSNENRQNFRRLIVRVEAETVDGGAICYMPYDSNPTLLTGADYRNEGFSDTTYAGLYQSTSSGYLRNTRNYQLTFPSNVDTVYIGLCNSSVNPGNTKNFRIYKPRTSKIYKITDTSQVGITTKFPVSNEIPANPGVGNSYPTGQFVLNSEPSSGEAQGWVYDGANWIASGNVDGSYWTQAATVISPRDISVDKIDFNAAGEIETTGNLTLDSSGAIISTASSIVQTSIADGFITYFKNDWRIRANTADASDTYQMSMCGGGEASATRGGFITIKGNEAGVNPGDIIMTSGDNADGDITLTATDDIELVATGEVSSTSSVNFGGGALEIPNGTTLPATCNVGQLFQDTDSDDCADTGAGDGALCICKTANTWALVSNF